MVGCYRRRGIKCRGQQRGTALIVSLIILSVVTFLGVSSMRSSNSELRMAASMRDRGVAFEAAEATLAIVEEQLAMNPPSRMDRLSNCQGTGCYNATCEGGLCFDGDYLMSYSEYECNVADYAGSSQRVEFWSDKTLDVWNKTNRHKTLQVDNLNAQVKYITEFLCYLPRDANTPFSELPNENNNGAPLYRITVLAQGNGNRATVALQSTYKVLNAN